LTHLRLFGPQRILLKAAHSQTTPQTRCADRPWSASLKFSVKLALGWQSWNLKMTLKF